MKVCQNGRRSHCDDHLFCSGEEKEDGTYVDVTGIVKEIDEYERCIVRTDKKKIPIEQVRAIEGELFKCLEL